jgi:hypothetical protein
MSSVRRLDPEKLRTRRIVATASLTVVTIAFLLLSDASAPVTAAPAAEASSTAEARQTPAGQAPISVSEMPRSVRPQEE